MHKVSRTLLLAGVMAFGGLAAACDSGSTSIVGNPGVQSITLTPPSASIPVGSTIQLAVSVVADANTAKTVTYTTSAAGVATVDATGKVTGVGAGTATIIATSTADASKAAASVITVTPVIPNVPNPSIAINSVTDVNGQPVTLNNVNGQINVTVNTSGGGLIEVFLSTSCTSNTIAASDVAVASQQATSAQPGTVTLSFNTAQLTPANQARFANGNYCIKTRLTNGASVVVATNTVPLTLNNANVFTATLAFASQTGGPVSAVSTLNGLNYNQGTLTVTLNPVIFTGASPAVFISGILTRNGEIGGAPVADLSFTNQAVTAGTATLVFTDTAGAPVTGLDIFGYTSLPAGDTLYVTSATDASGNPIPVGAGGIPVAVSNARGVRIDNQTPGLNGATFAVTAPNGYIPASYIFSTGTTGSPSDIHPPAVGGNPGVGGVTITYYVGLATSTAFTTPNSCTITGLTATTNTSNLQNTTATNTDRAKVIVKDALGNQTCADAPSTLIGGGGNFGVDKITPEASFVTTTVNGLAGVADQTGYNASRGFNLSFRDSISGFPQAAGSSPFTGTVKRTRAVAAVPADCVVGTYNATTGACADIAISTANVPTWFETTQAGSSFLLGGFQFTNSTNVTGYYTATLTTKDVAGNVLAPITRMAAFDPIAPVVAAPTQAAPAVPLGTATITAAATDSLDLISSRGNLIYGPITFARVTGNALGTFGQFVTSANATVTLSKVYRGLQDGSSGTIGAAVTLPSGTVTVTDVGGNPTPSAPVTITTTTASTPIALAVPPAGTQVTLTSSAANGVLGAPVATTNLTFQINGPSNNAAFQSQPFAAVDFYKLNSNGEYALVTSVASATVVDNTTTGVRTYTYAAPGVALTQSGAPNPNNTFLAIAYNAAGDAVSSNIVTQNNP